MQQTYAQQIGVAVLDTGIDFQNSIFDGRVLSTGKNFVNQKTNTSNQSAAGSLPWLSAL